MDHLTHVPPSYLCRNLQGLFLHSPVDEFGLIQPFVLSDRISYLRAGGFEKAGKIDKTAIVLPGRAPQSFNRGGGVEEGYRCIERG